MKREIKFRAWDIDKKEMRFHGKRKEYALTMGEEVLLNVYVLMQYTGVDDKNGVEIYEEDILKNHGVVSFGKYVTNNPENEDIQGYIILGKYRVHALDPQVSYEIIGNSYENPELLTDSK